MNRILRHVYFAACLATGALIVPPEAQGAGAGAYCAVFTDDGGMDCSYPSLQSCLASISGVGGSCNPNPRGPGGSAPPNLLQRMLRGNSPAFAPVDVGPPPDSGLSAAIPARRPTGNDGRYCSMLSDGSSNCSYPSFSSCLMAVSGVGGSCNVNPRITHSLPPPWPSH